MIKKIILDTNFLLIPAQFGVDIYSEIGRICDFKYELYVLDKTLDELDHLIKTLRGRDKAAVSLSMAIMKSKKPKTLKTSAKDYVDNVILGLKGYIIATQDKPLRSELKKKGVKTIVLRQKKYLIFD